VPIGHSPDIDLMAIIDGPAIRVQVKSCTYRHKGRWSVTLCTRGGNQSWSGLVKRLDPSRYDHLFVAVADGRRWWIPSNEVAGGSGLVLGGPKYERFEVERGDPMPRRHVLD
jgi:hypothetical protein